ncbi:MAG TPA: polyprenyl synthetase family protein, partial [Vicinamibacteria bacterium]|nr:polyprenyl synthetase family protein [Vicinamibacteria bacterium]
EVMVDLPRDASAEEMRRRLHAAAILAEAAGTSGLIGGQVADLEAEGRADVDGAALERLHRAKTGALISAPDEMLRLARYGAAIGLAFQVVDDVLDATEEAAGLGKTAGKDAAAGKTTYVRVHGLPEARRIAALLLEEAGEAVSPLGERAALLRALARLIVERRA